MRNFFGFYGFAKLDLYEMAFMWMIFQFISPCSSFQVPSNNNEDSSKTASNNSSSWSLQQASDLSGKVQELHDTLTRLRKESEDQIQRLKRESEDATKTIAKLQMQLQQQSDYELLKREVQ